MSQGGVTLAVGGCLSSFVPSGPIFSESYFPPRIWRWLQYIFIIYLCGLRVRLFISDMKKNYVTSQIVRAIYMGCRALCLILPRISMAAPGWLKKTFSCTICSEGKKTGAKPLSCSIERLLLAGLEASLAAEGRHSWLCFLVFY